MHCNWRANKKE